MARESRHKNDPYESMGYVFYSSQTQHFHKYNVGERTIEHHIVEHYVLHHRIKELLRNQHGLDVHNVDPRQASLIYRLLHPHKVAELDAQMPDTFITENEPTRRWCGELPTEGAWGKKPHLYRSRWDNFIFLRSFYFSHMYDARSLDDCWMGLLPDT